MNCSSRGPKRPSLRLAQLITCAEPVTDHGRAVAPVLYPSPADIDGLAIAVVEFRPSWESPHSWGVEKSHLIGFYPACVGLLLARHVNSRDEQFCTEEVICALGPKMVKVEHRAGSRAGEVAWARHRYRVARQDYHPDAAAWMSVNTLAAALDLTPVPQPAPKPTPISNAGRAACEVMHAAFDVQCLDHHSDEERARIIRVGLTAFKAAARRELAAMTKEPSGSPSPNHTPVLHFPSPEAS